MKLTVYKYQIPFCEKFSITLPRDSRVLRLDVESGVPYMWCLVAKDEKEYDEYHFLCLKTGGVLESDVPITGILDYVGMYHIFIQMELMLYVFLEKVVQSGATSTDVVFKDTSGWRN